MKKIVSNKGNESIQQGQREASKPNTRIGVQQEKGGIRKNREASGKKRRHQEDKHIIGGIQQGKRFPWEDKHTMKYSSREDRS